MSNKLTYLVIAVVAASAGWFGAQWANGRDVSPIDRENVLATVGDNVIDLETYRAAMRRWGGLRPGQYHTIEQKRALLDRLIKRSVMVAAALDDGLDRDPQVLAVWEKLLSDRYIELNLKPRLEKLKVSQEEIAAYYAENERKYIRPERRRAALILIKLAKNADQKKRDLEREKILQAREAIAQLDAKTTHFGKVATEYSDERASRYVGGVIGWFVQHPGRSYKWDQEIIDALFELEFEGDISPVLELPDGLALVRLVKMESKQEKEFSSVKKGVSNKLLHEHQLREKEAFRNEVAAGIEIEINETLLASVAPLSGKAVKSEQKPPALPSG